MTPMEGPAFLEDMHAAAKRYLSTLEGCITRTKELDNQEEASSVTEQVLPLENNTDRVPNLLCVSITSSHTSLLRPDRPSKRASAGGTATGLGAIPQN